jgi:HD-GYP domain-containing protein (c-di-GMP phosphodiesterase class II)
MDLVDATTHLSNESMNRDARVAVLEVELGQIEGALHALGGSDVNVPGLTRLVEPYMHIREARSKIQAGTRDVDALLAIDGPLDRALQATLFVVRNNVTRLGEELAATTDSLNTSSSQARTIAVFAALAAILVFAPIRFMAARAAAKPIQALKAATQAVADDRWNGSSMEPQSDDAIGELVSAFDIMAKRLRESRQDRSVAYRHTLASLVQAIEAKDAYTSNHSCNVSKFAEHLAQALGLPESECDEITNGGLLHDIGKIGIPDAIINKPGKLTAEEFAVIQQHPVIGGRIVKPLDGGEALLPPVRYHHESWDGTGYPDGLHGEQIPLAARIIAVADVFEAVTSDRPYRKRMPIEGAVRILKEEAGRKLDPQLVDTFCSEVIPKIKDSLLEPRAETATKPPPPLLRPSGDQTPKSLVAPPSR